MRCLDTLIAGDLDYFMGFHFVQTTELTKSARIRNCFAYAEGAIVLGDWEQVVFTADRLPTVNNEIGVIGRQTLGATRTQEKKVVQIDCQETTALSICLCGSICLCLGNCVCLSLSEASLVFCLLSMRLSLSEASLYLFSICLGDAFFFSVCQLIVFCTYRRTDSSSAERGSTERYIVCDDRQSENNNA
jgi:hypothetical protein